MSNPRTSIVELFAEARRLLRARDYEIAIQVCNEAIKLSPGFVGAYLTRAEAYKHLNMEQAAEADNRHAANLLVQMRRSNLSRGLYTALSGIAFTLAVAFGILAAAAVVASLFILFSLDFDVDVGGGVSMSEYGKRTLAGMGLWVAALAAGGACGLIGKLALRIYRHLAKNTDPSLLPTTNGRLAS